MASESRVFRNLATVEDDNTMTFQVVDTEVAYVNTLRRMILTGVESLAFNSKMNETGATTDVRILANTTPMTNEMLADRIGLIPVHIQEDKWSPEGWDKDLFEFRLSMENNTNKTMPVKAEHIEVFKKGRADEGYIPWPHGNKDFFRPDPMSGDTALIAVLKAKQPNQAPQKIEFVARASVGNGRDHIRWCPVSQCSYSYTIDTDPERQQQFFQRWLENHKKISLDSLTGEEGKKEALIREFQTMEVQRCFKVNEKGEPASFDFVVETIGTLPISIIVDRALYNIEQRCAKYAGELPSTVKVIPADARMKGFDFYFPEEDHTLGNLFQSFMEANLMDTNEISYVGYKVPHPLRAEMVLRVGVDFPTDKARDGKQTVARAAISRCAAGCALLFRQWREDWNRALVGPIGSRNRESLRLNVGNARALEEAAARVAPPKTPAGPGAKRVPQKSAFYGKVIDWAQQYQASVNAAAAQTQTQTQAAGPATPNYGAANASGSPNYGAVNWDQAARNAANAQTRALALPNASTPTYGAAPTSPAYAPTSPAYAPTTPNYGAAQAPLPEGWFEGRNFSGRPYYYTIDGRTQFDRPTQAATFNYGAI